MAPLFLLILKPADINLERKRTNMWLYHKNINDFDSEIWKQNDKKRNCFVRYVMKSNMALGKTKEDIKKLFGQEGNYFPFDRWTYFIGRGILGSRYLVFYFREEKVNKVKVELNK